MYLIYMLSVSVNDKKKTVPYHMHHYISIRLLQMK